MIHALLASGVLVGAVTMRVTGIGFALVAAPFFVLAVGPWDALGVMHVVGMAACAVLAVRLRGDVDHRRAVELGLWALLMVIPGSWLAFVVPRSVLQVAIGVGLLLSLCVMIGLGMRVPGADGKLVRAVTGAGCGLLTFTAGQGGPPLVIYSRLSGWDHRSFVATLQPLFLGLGIVALLGRWWVSGAPVPPVGAGVWILLVGALLFGLWVGGRVHGLVGAVVARRLVLLVAFAGSVVTIGHGALG